MTVEEIEKLVLKLDEYRSYREAANKIDYNKVTKIVIHQSDIRPIEIEIPSVCVELGLALKNGAKEYMEEIEYEFNTIKTKE